MLDGSIARTAPIGSAPTGENTLYSVSWSPDGSRLAVAGEPTFAAVLDASSQDVVCDLRGHTGEVRSISWSPDGKRLATASQDASIRVWDADSCAPEMRLAGH